jgi:hypothetical protein
MFELGTIETHKEKDLDSFRVFFFMKAGRRRPERDWREAG